MTGPRHPVARRAARAVAGALLTASALAACGGGANQNAAGTDTAAGGPPAGPAVGENKPANDRAYGAAQQRLDSLAAAGVKAENGIDSVGSRVQAQTANEPNRDTSRLNNRATPGGVSPSGRRP